MSSTSPIPTTPGSVLDYLFDWTAWLPAGDSIAAHQVDAVGATVNSSSAASGVVTAWATIDQTAPPGHRATLTCWVTTAQGRTDARVLELVAERR